MDLDSQVLLIITVFTFLGLIAGFAIAQILKFDIKNMSKNNNIATIIDAINKDLSDIEKKLSLPNDRSTTPQKNSDVFAKIKKRLNKIVENIPDPPASAAFHSNPTISLWKEQKDESARTESVYSERKDIFEKKKENLLSVAEQALKDKQEKNQGNDFRPGGIFGGPAREENSDSVKLQKLTQLYNEAVIKRENRENLWREYCVLQIENINAVEQRIGNTAEPEFRESESGNFYAIPISGDKDFWVIPKFDLTIKQSNYENTVKFIFNCQNYDENQSYFQIQILKPAVFIKNGDLWQINSKGSLLLLQ